MARSVYYDPFGSRLQGYRMGVQDETNLQDQTRRARGSDWDMDNMAPLRLNQAQRADQLGQYAMPYLQNQFGLNQRQTAANLAGTELPLMAEIGQATGNYAPWMATAMNFGSGQSVGSEQYLAPQVQMFDQQMQQGGPEGMPSMPDFSAAEQQFGLPPGSLLNFLSSLTGTVGNQQAQGIDQFYGFDRARTVAADQRQGNVDQWGRQVDQQKLQQGQQSADQTGGYYDYLRSRPAAGAAAGTGGGYTGEEDGF